MAMSAQTSKLISLFSLPLSTPPPVNSFHCAYLDGSIPYQGTLYLFPRHLAFHSTFVPLHPQKLVLPLGDVRQVKREKAMGLPTALSVHTDDKAYWFTSFINRDKCYTWIENNINTEGGEGAEDDEREDRDGVGEGGEAEVDGADVEDHDRSLSFESEEDALDEERPEVKAASKRRAAKPPHQRVLSASYRAGSRFSAGVGGREKDAGGGAGENEDTGLSKKERVMQKNAQRIREQKEKESEAEQQQAREQARKGKEKTRDQLMARLSPMNLVKTKQQKTTKTAEEGRGGASEDEEDDHGRAEVEAVEDDEEEEDRPVRTKRPVKKEEEKQPEESGSFVDDESSPDYLPPQPHTLYQPRTFTAADPLVTAIALRFSSLTSSLDTRNRRYVHDGAVLRQGRFSVVHRQMFLFSDKLILAKVKGRGNGQSDRLEMKQQMSLDGMLIDIRPLSAQRKECMDTKLIDPFRVLFIKEGKMMWIVLSVEGAKQRKEWVKKIQLAASRVQWVRAKEEGKSLDWGWYTKIVKGSIHLAALENKEEEMKAMIEREPSLIDERDQEGLSPLMIAAHLNHSFIISLLLSHQSLIDLRDADSRTALHIAAKLGYAESVAVLLKDERLVCRSFHPKSGRLSISSAVWMAALAHRGEYESCIKMLVDHCRTRRWPSASRSALLDQRDLEGRTLLELCTSLSLTDVIPIVVGLGATLDLAHPSLHLTPLCLAAQQKDLESLTTLIQLGAQPNWRDPISGAGVIHYSASLEVASFLVAHGARMGMRTKDGTRITDIYGDHHHEQTLMQAESLYQGRKPVESGVEKKGRPRSVSANGGHPLDSCAVCSDGVGGFGGVMKKVGWCARCGLIQCSPCLRQQLIFTSGGGQEEVAPVCAGCYNVCMYSTETEQKKKRRIERQRKAAEEAKQSLFTDSGINLDYLTDVLTAVHITQHGSPSDPHTLQGNQILGQMKIQETIPELPSAAPAVAASSSPARRSPHPVVPAPSSMFQRKQSIGPGMSAGKDERLVNYIAGGALNTAKGGKKLPQLALNNAPVVNRDSSPRGGGSAKKKGQTQVESEGVKGMKSSASMDGVSDRYGKKGRPVERKVLHDVELEDEREGSDGDWTRDEVHDTDRQVKQRKEEPVPAKNNKSGKVEKRVDQRRSNRAREEKEEDEDGEEVIEDEPVVEPRRVALKKKSSKAALSVDVDDNEEAIVTKTTVLGRRTTTAKRPVVRNDDDFT